MTIYIICPKLSGRGGIETVLTIVIRQFIIEGFNVVLYIQGQPEYTKWLEELNIKVIYGGKYSHLFKLTNLFISANHNSRFLIASTSRVSLLGCFIRKILCKKWLLYHWLHFSLNMDNDYSYLNKSDGVLAISSSIVHQLKHFNVDSKKIHLIYNPCALDQERDIATLSKQKRFVYVGRLEDKQKNLSELLRALSMVNKKDIVLNVYGDGQDMGKYKKLCKKLKLENTVIWHGWKDKVWNAMSYRPDALILPSRFEGFPMILLEAMKRGIPCITSDFLGYQDIIIDKINGMHYRLGHPEELARILDSFDAKAFSSKMIKNSIEKFSQEKYFLRLKEAIRI